MTFSGVTGSSLAGRQQTGVGSQHGSGGQQDGGLGLQKGSSIQQSSFYFNTMVLWLRFRVTIVGTTRDVNKVGSIYPRLLATIRIFLPTIYHLSFLGFYDDLFLSII